jgi:hypothetical protein
LDLVRILPQGLAIAGPFIRCLLAPFASLA